MNVLVIDSAEVVREAFRIGLPLDELIELPCVICQINVFAPLELLQRESEKGTIGLCCTECYAQRLVDEQLQIQPSDEG